LGICNVNFTTDIKNNNYVYVDECNQGDTLIIDVPVLDNSVMADLTGYTCVMNTNKADGKGYDIARQCTVTVSNGNIHVECPSSLTQFAGNLSIQFRLNNPTTGLQKSTFEINMKVNKSNIADTNGNVPAVIITQLEDLTNKLNQIAQAIQNANSANTTLTNNTGIANSTNNTLVSNTSNANTTNSNLLTNTAEAKNTIQALKDANGEYTQHIKNKDIHVTLDDKTAWNLAIKNIEQLFKMLGGGYLKDENGGLYTDENGGHYKG
jgi:hypothetical protein